MIIKLSTVDLCCMAGYLSYIVNDSIWWAILHFFCSWYYLIYWALFKSGIFVLVGG